jgi:hypothetical protein
MAASLELKVQKWVRTELASLRSDMKTELEKLKSEIKHLHKKVIQTERAPSP